MTQIKKFEEFSQKILGTITNQGLHDDLVELFKQIKSGSHIASGFEEVKSEPGAVVVSKQNFERLMTIITTTPELFANKDLDQYFHHQVVEFPLNLSLPKKQALQEKLLKENEHYPPLANTKHFYTQNQRIEALLALSLPNQQVFHFDYYAKQPHQPTQQGLCILRHHSPDEEIEADGSFMKFDQMGNIVITRGMPNRYDTTQTVRITHQMEVGSHDKFISPKDQKYLKEIESVFGISPDYFVQKSLESDLGFFQARTLSKGIEPASAATLKTSEIGSFRAGNI